MRLMALTISPNAVMKSFPFVGPEAGRAGAGRPARRPALRPKSAPSPLDVRTHGVHASILAGALALEQALFHEPPDDIGECGSIHTRLLYEAGLEMSGFWATLAKTAYCRGVRSVFPVSVVTVSSTLTCPMEQV